MFKSGAKISCVVWQNTTKNAKKTHKKIFLKNLKKLLTRVKNGVKILNSSQDELTKMHIDLTEKILEKNF